MTGQQPPTTATRQAIDTRIAERRHAVRKERQHKRLRRTLLVLALAVLVALGYVVEHSSLVALAEIRVSGTERLDPATVEQASGLKLGTSTLRLHLGAAVQRVEKLPLVASASAHRVDPLTVEIDVTERTPVVLAVAGGQHRLVDADGVILSDAVESGLPQIVLTRQTRLPAPGADVSADPALANAHRAFRELPGPLRATVVRYEANGPDDLDLILDSGVRVRFGRATRVAEKARSLGAVLEDVGDTPISVVDVRAPMNPVVKP